MNHWLNGWLRLMHFFKGSTARSVTHIILVLNCTMLSSNRLTFSVIMARPVPPVLNFDAYTRVYFNQQIN